MDGGKKIIKNRNTACALFVAVFVILWNVLDLLWSALIAKTPYQFSMMTDLGPRFYPQWSWDTC